MTDERKVELFDEAVQWVEDHTGCFGLREYLNALKRIGLKKKEAMEYIGFWGHGENDAYLKILDDVYGGK